MMCIKRYFLIGIICLITQQLFSQSNQTSIKDTLYEHNLSNSQRDEWNFVSGNIYKGFIQFLSKHKMKASCDSGCDLLNLSVCFIIDKKGNYSYTILSKTICGYKLSKKQLTELNIMIKNRPISFPIYFYNKIFIVDIPGGLRLMC